MEDLNLFPDQKTPSRPIGLTFGESGELASDNQEVTLVGHLPVEGNSLGPYERYTVQNSGDPDAAFAELEDITGGEDSELTKMVIAAINANRVASEGATSFPRLHVIGIANGRPDFGPANEAMKEADRYKTEYLVSPYDFSVDSNRNLLRDQAIAMSSGLRTDNRQFGTFGVAFNRSIEDFADFPAMDKYNMILAYLRDTGAGDLAPDLSIAECAAKVAARLASRLPPFNPMDSVSVGDLAVPKKKKDWLTIGGAMESEALLNKGILPLYSRPDGYSAFVRTVTTRISTDDSATPNTYSYIDVQDFNVLFYWRRAQYERFAQRDWKERKASEKTAGDYLGELIKLGDAFQDGGMFQNMDKLAPLFKVGRSTTDRSKFLSRTPVNVIPGLHGLGNNTVAGTFFDTISLGG